MGRRPVFGRIPDVRIRWMALMAAILKPEFRAFQNRRPDHERWELLVGVPMMMTPPTIRVQPDRE